MAVALRQDNDEEMLKLCWQILSTQNEDESLIEPQCLPESESE